MSILSACASRCAGLVSKTCTPLPYDPNAAQNALWACAGETATFAATMVGFLAFLMWCALGTWATAKLLA
jgi:hypothetical protein